MQPYLKLISSGFLAMLCYGISWKLQLLGQPGLSLLMLVPASIILWLTLIAFVDLFTPLR